MPYRDEDRLGPKVSEHRLTEGGAASWFGAGVLGVVMVPLFLYLATSGREVSPKLLLGTVMMGALAVWAFKEWWRLRAISLTLHERGLRYQSGATVEMAIIWEEIAQLEARYVPGVRKRGTADDGNRVALLIRTSSGVVIDVPKELAGFHQLADTIAQRCGKSVDKVLVQNLMQR